MGGSQERLGEPSDCDIGLIRSEEEREGKAVGWKHVWLQCTLTSSPRLWGSIQAIRVPRLQQPATSWEQPTGSMTAAKTHRWTSERSRGPWSIVSCSWRLSERHMSGPPHLVSSSVKQDNIHAHLTPRAVVWLRGGDVYEYFVNSKVWSM